MNLDGELSVRVDLDNSGEGVRVLRTELRSTRPHLGSRIFTGRSVQDVVSLVPKLFSVCGRAQGVASALACEAAAGAPAEPVLIEARRLLVGVELAQEGLWRTLIDWPRAMGGEPAAQRLAAARHAIEATLAELTGALGFMAPPPAEETVAASGVRARAVAGAAVSREVLGVPHARWEGLRTPEELGAWSASNGTPAARLVAWLQDTDANFGACEVALIPRIDGETAGRLAHTLEADTAFARAPQWRGVPAETGPLARMHAHPLVASLVERFGRSALARFVARLAELCAFASGASPELGSGSPGAGRGIAWVETARGLLLHDVAVKNGCVQHYRIVAPTEWNFHPQGALVRGLAGRAFADQSTVCRAVGLLVQSLDPCVAWKLEFSHA